MFTIGLDLHKRETQLCVGHEDGTFEEWRIATTRDRFTAVLAAYSPARILLEASTESEWVARHLERLGHGVIVADPRIVVRRGKRISAVALARRLAGILYAMWGDNQPYNAQKIQRPRSPALARAT